MDLIAFLANVGVDVNGDYLNYVNNYFICN